MNVGIVAWEFPPEIGGMESYACEFARELSRRAYRVTVFTQRHHGGEAAMPGIRVLPVLVGRRGPDWATLRQYDVDVWHVMNAAFAWLALETPAVVVSAHGNDFLDPYVLIDRPDLGSLPILWRWKRAIRDLERALGRTRTRRTVRRALPRARQILTNSRYTERVLLEHLPECAGRTSAAMVGVSEQFFVPMPRSEEPRVASLITISRLAEPRKNVDMVLRALASLKVKHEFNYTVVGDGYLRPRLERLAAELDLHDRVSFTGFIPADEVRRRLADSDLFVLTSSVQPGSHEGFGIAYLEANACGIPVLAARLAGAIEAVREGETGFFVDTPDEASITGALDRFLSGQVHFESEACRAFARRFSWSEVVTHAVRWYGPPRATPAATEAAAAPTVSRRRERSADLVSVVMPCFNASPYVEDAVRSALEQDDGDVELIAVDDGSSDGSRDILARLAREYAGRLTLLATDRRGPYPARNLALLRAKGRFIAFLDADDYWAENCLSMLRRALAEQDADLAYCGWQNVGEGAPGTNPCIPADYLALDPVEQFLRSCPWPIHAALVRREVIDALGGFSERLFSSMDYDLWLRVLAHTRKIVRVPAVLAYYRWHSHGQISQTKWRQVRDARSVRLEFLRRHAVLAAHLPASKIRELTDGVLLQEAYRAYWRRDLASAQPLFRSALWTRTCQVKDLRYALPSLLPAPMYRRLIGMVDRSNPEPTT